MAMMAICSRWSKTPVGRTVSTKAPAAASFHKVARLSIAPARMRPLSARLTAEAASTSGLTRPSGATPVIRPSSTAGR